MKSSKSNNKTTKPFVNIGALQYALAQTHLAADKSRRLLEFFGMKSDIYGCCFYAQRTIAEELGLSDRCIRNYLKSLKDHGSFSATEVCGGHWRAKSSVSNKKTGCAPRCAGAHTKEAERGTVSRFSA